MRTFKYRFFRWYKRTETFLRSHPFWPSFLSNGGVLVLILVLCIGFTLFCGWNSLKDVHPELSYASVTFRGDEYTALYDIRITHDKDKITPDTVSICYHLTQKTKEPEDQYDESRLDAWMRERLGNTYSRDNALVSEFEFATTKPYEHKLSAHNIDNIYLNIKEGEMRPDSGSSHFFGVTEADTDMCYRKYDYCEKGYEDKYSYNNEIFVGNFLSSKKTNPYIYFEFHLNGEFEVGEKSGKIVFKYNLKDPRYDDSYSPVNILQVFPEPTYASTSFLIYEKEELGKVIANNGFNFLGEDLGIKRRTEKSTFVWTVLFGTAIAATVDILVNLILKWRGILPGKRRRRK